MICKHMIISFKGISGGFVSEMSMIIAALFAQIQNTVSLVTQRNVNYLRL